MEKVDVFISGGGIAGMVAAVAFERLGYSVICADPRPPVQTRDENGADLRTTAFLQPSQQFLDELGLWSRVKDHATPLDIMRIVDAGGAEEPNHIKVSREFDARELSDLPFGWNVPNWLSRRALSEALEASGRAEFLAGVETKQVFTRDSEARVLLSNGMNLSAALVIGADGRNSLVRKSAGISVRTTRFGQKAMAFAVTHPIPHNNVSTEIHRHGGPFTLVPLPDYDGQPSSAVVWMETSAQAARLMALSPEAFEAEMSERSCHILGPLALATERSIWPIIAQLAERISAKRVALIAEAAHVVPPIGAQGLNMSLSDIKALRDLAAQAEDIGAPEVLERYHNARFNDIRLRVNGISMLNHTSLGDMPLLSNMRALGIQTLHGAAPVRKGLMKLGLGLGQR
ncbi:MAG: UbiH/UbiF family hydroxylase [Paracoccaceae bacterium]